MMFVHLLPVVVMDFCEVWLTQASRPFPMLSLPDAVHDFRSPLDRINALSLRHQVSELFTVGESHLLPSFYPQQEPIQARGACEQLAASLPL
jgi:hypothetical protein